VRSFRGSIDAGTVGREGFRGDGHCSNPWVAAKALGMRDRRKPWAHDFHPLIARASKFHRWIYVRVSAVSLALATDGSFARSCAHGSNPSTSAERLQPRLAPGGVPLLSATRSPSERPLWKSYRGFQKPTIARCIQKLHSLSMDLS
jgi:hypothetical protein